MDRQNRGTAVHNDTIELSAADGRRKRSERSRAKIIDALFSLIQSGDMDPSAAQVAERAGVSLRSVFRHFEEMDSLYREMTIRVESEIMPIAKRPLEGEDWRARLAHIMERRADIYERIMPLRVAASLRRFRSAYLMEDYTRFLKFERDSLKAALPDYIAGDELLFSALEMVLGFQAWRRMRQDQGLSTDETKKVVALTAKSLLVES